MEVHTKEGSSLTVAPLYELSPDQSKCLADTIDRELKAGRIRRSHSQYGSPSFLVKKKSGDWRLVVDYRKINNATIGDAYPLPLISQVTNKLAQAQWYCALDLVGAYQLLRMREGHKKYTAFRTHLGMFESLVVRDGLKNAPPCFQHFVHEVFLDLINKGVIVYIDNILIYAKSLDKLRRLTCLVLERLQQHSPT
jgi:hypothetical protein